MKLVSVAQMKAIEQAANAAGVSYEEMMERAGTGLAAIIVEDFAEQPGLLTALALVGSGNNGGDALVALRELWKAGWQVTAYLVGRRPADDALLKLLSPSLVIQDAQDPAFERLKDLLEESDVLIDGVLGTGVRLPLKPGVAKVLRFVSSQADLPYVVAVDCPSGTDCDHGEIAPETIAADLTVCMQAVKTGLLSFPAYEKIGGLEVVDLGLPASLSEWEQVSLEVADDPRVNSLLPARPLTAHKGTFGTALVVAGSLNYTGAAYLACRAAYLIGAGLVQAGIPAPLHTALAGQLPEVTWLLLPHVMGVVAEGAAEVVLSGLERVTALLVGPGFGLEETSAAFIRKLLAGKGKHGRRIGLGFMEDAPRPGSDTEKTALPALVMDADGLRLLSRLPDWWKLLPPGSILTPHPGEMAALTGLEIGAIQARRLETAQEYAARWGQVVVLKGALTVVASPDGRAGVIPVANPALARAGTGDVLAGMITGLRAQGVPAYEAALAGAYLHAQAGLEALLKVGTAASVMARDVLEAIPAVLEGLEELIT